MPDKAKVVLETVNCACGRGVIEVKVTEATRGIVTFRTLEPTPCTACGSKHIGPVEPKTMGAAA